jgi:hypothetical protein
MGLFLLHACIHTYMHTSIYTHIMWVFFNFRKFLWKLQKQSQCLGILFSRWNLCFNFDKNGIGYILGDFLQTHFVTLSKGFERAIGISHKKNRLKAFLWILFRLSWKVNPGSFGFHLFISPPYADSHRLPKKNNLVVPNTTLEYIYSKLA